MFHVPSAIGRAAFTELDRVRWDDLEHAYHQKGTPKRGAHDIAASLRKLGDAHASSMDEEIQELFSIICHQGGTIYEATAYAVPFLLAFAADTALSHAQAQHFVELLGSIGVASSFESRGTDAGAFGPGVGLLTRQAVRASTAHLEAMALRTPALAELASTLAALVRTDSPDAAAVARLRALTEDEDEDD